ncbi:MAG: FCD domain-containing protein [Micrococcales bacterium]|nr:FCD domain-containing protein [Micrococcales bacterium]
MTVPTTDSTRLAYRAWRPVAQPRAYELVVDRIEEQIYAGVLTVGDRLPAERDLASMLGVSRAAVREAIRALAAQGVLASAVGAGRDAGTTVAAMPSEALTRFLRLHVALANFPMPDVVDARVMLERGSVRLAARQRDAEALRGLEVLLTRMETPGLDREEFNDLDSDFHIALAEAGGNRLVADITTAIRASMRLPILQSCQATGAWRQISTRLCRGHRTIVDAVASGEGDTAAAAVESHIRYAYEALLYTR